MFRRTKVLVGLLALVGAIALPATGAGAATTYKVQVGAPSCSRSRRQMAPPPWVRFLCPIALGAPG